MPTEVCRRHYNYDLPAKGQGQNALVFIILVWLVKLISLKCFDVGDSNFTHGLPKV